MMNRIWVKLKKYYISQADLLLRDLKGKRTLSQSQQREKDKYDRIYAKRDGTHTDSTQDQLSSFFNADE